MIGIIKERSAHSDRVERWFGDNMAGLSQAMLHGGGKGVRWYGPPISVGGVPGGNLRIGADGDFIGRMPVGSFASRRDWRHEQVRRRKQWGAVALADLVAPRWGGLQVLRSDKTPAASVTLATYSFAQMGAWPANMGAASAAPGGRAPTRATTGALPYVNPTVVGAHARVLRHWFSNIGGQRWTLLYDRIFDVAKTMSSIATEAVTGTPSRYQGATRGNDDYAGGNFLFPEVVAALGATSHNWTVCQYTDQDGNTGVTLPSFTGVNSAGVGRQDFSTQGQWFAPLAAGDDGVAALTQMQCSASVTGTLNFVIGHPLSWGAADSDADALMFDGILSSFDMSRVFDDACLCLIGQMNSTAASANESFIEILARVP